MKRASFVVHDLSLVSVSPSVGTSLTCHAKVTFRQFFHFCAQCRNGTKMYIEDAVAKRTAQAVCEDICKLSGSLIMKKNIPHLFQQSHGGPCHV